MDDDTRGIVCPQPAPRADELSLRNSMPAPTRIDVCSVLTSLKPSRLARLRRTRVPIERRSITFVPEHDRHGRVSDQGPFWFLSNFHFFAIAIGFVGPALGLSLVYTALAGTSGILIGTTFQAFHAAQGPQLGLPQMIQSRAQFGYRGVVVPLLAVFVSLVGYNIVATVILSEGMQTLWSLRRSGTAIGILLLAAMLAVWGYDWLHRIFRILFWVSLPLFSLLSIAILAGKAGGTSAPLIGGRQAPASLS